MEPEETAGQAAPAPGPGPRADLEAFLNNHYRYFLMAPMALGATVDDAHEAVQAAVADMLEKDKEAFPSWLSLAGLQYVDGLGELAGAPGAAAELTENPPGLELGVRALAGCAEPGVGAVSFFLRFRLVLPPVRDLRVALPW